MAVMKKQKMRRQAGEVRFIKDHGDDSSAWAWGQHPPSQRIMDQNHVLNKKCSKDLAKVLRATLIALGNAMSAYTVFAKIKSRDISPDGNLGGRGYIMEIKSIRRQYMNIVEALSAISDTIYDEMTADHWAVAQTQLVKDALDEIEEIKEDPEAWAMFNESNLKVSDDEESTAEKGEEEGLTRDFTSERRTKQASLKFDRHLATTRVAHLYLARRVSHE
jgi:hypothetical protein